MKGRSKFSRNEVRVIRAALKELRRIDCDNPKRIRDRLREHGFYISDWGRGLTVANFDALVEDGTITVLSP